MSTPTLPPRLQTCSTPGTPLEQARVRLHVSALPDTLPCREEEFADVYHFVRGKVCDDTGGYVFHLSCILKLKKAYLHVDLPSASLFL